MNKEKVDAMNEVVNEIVNDTAKVMITNFLQEFHLIGSMAREGEIDTIVSINDDITYDICIKFQPTSKPKDKKDE